MAVEWRIRPAPVDLHVRDGPSGGCRGYSWSETSFWDFGMMFWDMYFCVWLRVDCDLLDGPSGGCRGYFTVRDVKVGFGV